MKEKIWKVGVSFKLKIFMLVLPKRGHRVEVKMQRLRMKKKRIKRWIVRELDMNWRLKSVMEFCSVEHVLWKMKLFSECREKKGRNLK